MFNIFFLRNKALSELTQVHGIGPKKALELYEQNGIDSLEKLYTQRELLSDVQKIGLR